MRLYLLDINCTICALIEVIVLFKHSLMYLLKEKKKKE